MTKKEIYENRSNARTKSVQTLEMDLIIEKLAAFAVSDEAKHMAKSLKPKMSLEAIRKSHEEISEARRVVDTGALPPLNTQTGVRLGMDQIDKGLVLSPQSLYTVASFIADMTKLSHFLAAKVELAPHLSQYGASAKDLSELHEDLIHCIGHDMVLDHASPDLSRVRKRLMQTEDKIKDKLEKVLRHPAYKDALQDALIAQRGGRYVVPVKAAYKKQIEGQIHDRSASGATMFIEPAEVKTLHDELSKLRAEEERICYRIQSELTNAIALEKNALLVQLEIMTHCDWTFARAKLSKEEQAAAPQMSDALVIQLNEARHPLLGNEAVPLTLTLGVRQKGLIITGPNTGGKTVAMKTVGLLTHMAHCGLHIPCTQGSVIGNIQCILADIGDGQSISQSLSTFSAHMTNIADILSTAHEHTLVLLDEVGSGTDPREGMGIAIAILEALYEKGCLIMASTHYGEIKAFGESHKGFINGSMGFDVHSLKPLYKLTVGKFGESNGLLIAKRLGMPENIIERAAAIVSGGGAFLNLKEATEALIDDCHVPKIDFVAEKAPQVSLQKLHFEEVKSDAEELQKEEYEIGDQVKIPYLGLQGMVVGKENGKGEIEIQVRDKRMTVSKKRLVPYLKKKDLYPEDYDMDVVLKSKDYRKKNKLISKGKGKGLIIEY